jgi:hypothetical protein
MWELLVHSRRQPKLSETLVLRLHYRKAGTVSGAEAKIAVVVTAEGAAAGQHACLGGRRCPPCPAGQVLESALARSASRTPLV